MKNNIKQFCKKYNLTEEQFFGKEKIEGSLDLPFVTEIPKGFNPIVCGYLDLSYVTEIPKGFNPIVGGGLYLSSLKTIPKGFNPIIGGGLYLSSVTKLPKGFNPTVGYSLFLNSVTKLPEGFNPTVGESLFLNSVTKLPEGFNPTVGYSLYLSSVTKLPEGFNPTVGYSLYLKNERKTINNLGNKIIFWEKYLRCDGIFSEILHRKGNIFKVKDISLNKILFIYSDGNEVHAHGKTLKEAKKQFDEKNEVLKIKSEPINLETVFTVSKYKLLTGACNLGIELFLKKNNIPYKIVNEEIIEEKPMVLSELLPLLEKNNEYGLNIIKQKLGL